MERMVASAASLFALVSGQALAVPWALTTEGPYQFEMTSDGAVPHMITDGTYQRDDYPWTGALLYMVTYRDERTSYVANTNHHWQFSFTNPQTGERLGYAAYSYNAETNCFYDDASGVAVACNVSIPEGRYGFWIFTLGAGTYSQCIPEETTYSMESQIDSTAAGPWAFEPTIFHAAPPVVAKLKPISPYLPARSAGKDLRIRLAARPAGTADVTGTVLDKTGCGLPIPNARLVVKNTMVPQSGSHVHLISEDQSGAGDYVNASSEWKALDSTKSAIEMTTAQDGTFSATYKAGNVGIREKVAVEVFDRDDSGSAKSEEYLDIRVPGLIPLDTSEITYTIVGSYASVCDRGHNDGKYTVSRRSNYVTPYTYQQIQNLNDLWLSTVGDDNLCLNDASLEYGGFFDDGSGDFSRNCHSSHRRGIDVDVNKYTTGCPENLNETVMYGGREWPKWKVLDVLAREELHAYKARESSLHYRFSH